MYSPFYMLGTESHQCNEWPQIRRLWLSSPSGISHQSKTEFSRAENSSAGAWWYPAYKVHAMALELSKEYNKECHLCFSKINTVGTVGKIQLTK